MPLYFFYLIIKRRFLCFYPKQIKLIRNFEVKNSMERPLKQNRFENFAIFKAIITLSYERSYFLIYDAMESIYFKNPSIFLIKKLDLLYS